MARGSFPTCPLLSLVGGCMSSLIYLIDFLPLVGEKSEKQISMSTSWPSKDRGCSPDSGTHPLPSPHAGSSYGVACVFWCPVLNNECWHLTPVLVVVITERREIISQFKLGFNTELGPSTRSSPNIPGVRHSEGHTSMHSVGMICLCSQHQGDTSWVHCFAHGF